MADYVLGIDQSTQGTKALLFDQDGALVSRADLPHRQMIDERGWVEHDPEEIWNNTLRVVQQLVEQSGIDKGDIRTVGISNQRETALVWEKDTGKPIYNAVVWQCARGAEICQGLEQAGHREQIHVRTGLTLSPYFSAAKLAWVLRNVSGAQQRAEQGELCCGTVDSWLVYKLTSGKEFRTDYSNASRTQLFNIHTLQWDEQLCEWFQIPMRTLAQVTDSDGYYGQTDFDGFLEHPIPIHGVLGDSHGALFGQGCHQKGMVKATYGTGSSIMMNIGQTPVMDPHIVTSLAWSMGGTVHYVLEGNINYTGAVITWLKDDLGLISSAAETSQLAEQANPQDTTYLVPAFSGLGAPYWDSEAKATLCGMSRTTQRREIVKAGLECIAYQITDVITAMKMASGVEIQELRVDGGPTRNRYLMQFQSDIAGIPVQVPQAEELSGIGAAYAAGLAIGLYQADHVFGRMQRQTFTPQMIKKDRENRYAGWKHAVSSVLSDSK